ncbi:MAG: hypothetical protein IT371_23695 [Deltaproteobacteria bacterium]|nr:hypothetical protein [Deltaproteobacteria bacterium]
MDPRLEEFVSRTRAERTAPLRTVDDLRQWRPAPKDWLDAAVLGGTRVAEILLGRVTDADLEPQVVEAFHTEYPHLGSLTERLQSLSGDDDALRGLVSGVKGKLFELRYVEQLNAGGLPEGFHAELAESPTQPGWDVAIRGPDGEITELLQLKATADLDYVRGALERHPEIDVVAPHELVEGADVSHDVADHLIDSKIALADLHDTVGDAVDAAGAAAGLDVVPELALAFIAGQAVFELARRSRPAEAVLQDAASRGGKAMIAAGVGGVLTWLAGPWVGVPATVGTRLLLRRRDVMASYGKAAEVRLERIRALALRMEQAGAR